MPDQPQRPIRQDEHQPLRGSVISPGRAYNVSEVGTAVFSHCGTWRYMLRREVFQSGPSLTVVFVCLNPSTADEANDDPTVRRCVGFARRWGYRRLVISNLFALRSTDPAALYEHEDPIGPENDHWIEHAARSADLVIAAWGNHGTLRGRGRAVSELLYARHNVRLLGVTGRGEPRHPLYLPAYVEPVDLAQQDQSGQRFMSAR
jgi:hypothetical protein